MNIVASFYSERKLESASYKIPGPRESHPETRASATPRHHYLKLVIFLAVTGSPVQETHSSSRLAWRC
ncbi:hypothetical protein P691DRAFT_377278 [Macrolepiota fuliginosa MF-IS2]|uniref:Uncharacterized protein n=1 Tax=Macrolepiota fuliginosa MF-IS2 TaxID=1400762 RepID=A0A9P5X633_9AGAR|nr:hypothetical protein P691DRAFT_377278 [Macrolepiota fuliginosa MF-IS2]